MTPASSQNLDAFLKAYSDVGAYYLAPAVVGHGGQYPEPIGESRILKRELIVREAWEIGRNDPDGAGILPGDDPIVPDGVSKAPVKELLDSKRTRFAEAERKKEITRSPSSSAKSRKEKRKKEKQMRQQVRTSRKRNRK
jgi:hypothetical protein